MVIPPHLAPHHNAGFDGGRRELWRGLPGLRPLLRLHGRRRGAHLCQCVSRPARSALTAPFLACPRPPRRVVTRTGCCWSPDGRRGRSRAVRGVLADAWSGAMWVAADACERWWDWHAVWCTPAVGSGCSQQSDAAHERGVRYQLAQAALCTRTALVLESSMALPLGPPAFQACSAWIAVRSGDRLCEAGEQCASSYVPLTHVEPY